MKELAQELYEAYCAHTGGVSLITSQLLPEWNNLNQGVKDAWQAVADKAFAWFDVDRDRV